MDACELNFFRQGEVGSLVCMPSVFQGGFQMVTPSLIPPQKCIMFSMVPLQMLQLFWDDMQQLVYRHTWKHLGTCSWDLPLSLMKLSSGKKRNFTSWEYSPLVAAYQDAQIIRWQIEGIFLLLHILSFYLNCVCTLNILSYFNLLYFVLSCFICCLPIS